jgi:hypothetical protein
VLTGDIHIVLPPSDVPGEGLTGRSSCDEGDIPATVELEDELIEGRWITEIAPKGAAAEVMTMGRDRIGPDVGTEDHLKTGPVQAQAQTTGSTEEIDGQWCCCP